MRAPGGAAQTRESLGGSVLAALYNLHPLTPAFALAMKRDLPDIETVMVAVQNRAQREWRAEDVIVVLDESEQSWLSSLDPQAYEDVRTGGRLLGRKKIRRGAEEIEVGMPATLVVETGVLREALLAGAGRVGIECLNKLPEGGAYIPILPRYKGSVGYGACQAYETDTESYTFLFDPDTGAQARAIPLPTGGTLLVLVGPLGGSQELAHFATVLGLSGADRLAYRENTPLEDGVVVSEAVTLPISRITLVGASPGGAGEGVEALRALTWAWRERSNASWSELEAAVAQAWRAAQHPRGNQEDWFSNWQRYAHLPIGQFAFSLTTATQRVGYADTESRDPDSVRLAALDGAGGDPSLPPAFTPFAIGDVTLPNRIVMSSMCMYSAEDGLPNEFHLVHLGARALGGAGLIMTEMTAVSQGARITPGCAGIWTDAQRDAWSRIVDFVHANGDAAIGLQLGHAGPKGSTCRGWEGMDRPLNSGNWPLVAASPLPYADDSQTPVAADAQALTEIVESYERAADRAKAAGFDFLEVHAAHGYLLSSFLSPVTNRRTDEFGGSLENRLRFPLRIVEAVRVAWPRPRPLSVRISAVDWIDGGNEVDEGVALARAFTAAGADIIDVSTGQITPASRPVYGRTYQVPFSDRIRNEVGCPTITVGAITTADQVNTIIAAGRADLCALARPHLSDPAWTLRAMSRQGVRSERWPKQYLAGKAQMEREQRFR